VSTTSHSATQHRRLEVSSRNPRYFTVADGPDAGRRAPDGPTRQQELPRRALFGAAGATDPVVFDFDEASSLTPMSVWT
jgi:hypothetical protein